MVNPHRNLLELKKTHNPWSVTLRDFCRHLGRALDAIKRDPVVLFPHGNGPENRINLVALARSGERLGDSVAQSRSVPFCAAMPATLKSNAGQRAKRSWISTLSALASWTISLSPIQRRCPSIFATVSRAMSHPCRWHRAASSVCDKPAVDRKRRIVGPMMFLGASIGAGISTNPKDQPALACARMGTYFVCQLGPLENSMTPPTHYDVLNVSRAAELEVIKMAYKALALKYHPDHNRENRSDQRMKAINAAYEVLSSPSARAEYDRMLSDSEPVFLTKKDIRDAVLAAERESSDRLRRSQAMAETPPKAAPRAAPSEPRELKTWEILLIKFAIVLAFFLVTWWMTKTDGYRIWGYILLIAGGPALIRGLFDSRG